MKHVLDANQFTQDKLSSLFSMSQEIERWCRRKKDRVANRDINMFDSEWRYFRDQPFDHVVATLFTEPSTRTKSSFETATMKLGGTVLPIDFRRSSMEKGESFEDTIKTVSQYADLMVIRHHEEGMVARAAEVATVPVINGGDGAGEHPTQSLIDLYTIHKKFPSIDGLKILFVGDNEKSRTVNSLRKMLELYDVDVKLFSEKDDLEKCMKTCDVLYVTRFQRERWTSAETPPMFAEGDLETRIDLQKVSWMKESSIILHPLPRTIELSPSVDQDPRACYWEQVENGVYVRMALLKYVLGHLDW